MNVLALALLLAAADPDPGVLPAGADGKPLNLDFETGTLKDWTAQGEAFKDQPIDGDTVAARRADMKSRHQGRYWVGSYEKLGDTPQGTLGSVPFKVTHPWASFLIGGGSHATDTCVELLDVESNSVFFRTSGEDAEDLKRVAVDLTKHVGRTIRVRLIDRQSGGWGHVNFDDFRFHAAKPNVPERKLMAVDVYPYSGQKPTDAAKNMTVPPGFTVTLFAGEPDLHQPVGFCTDDRGRLWVVEAFCYPQRKPYPGPMLLEEKRKEGDKIVIFEDADGDGTFDKRTVFMEGLNLVSGIEIGFGGVWVGAAPYLLFVPDKDRDDKPDGPPQVLLDGWGYEDTHETLNSFVWGPDGWLYGCHGVFTHSKVGKPGTPDDKREKINAGVWRYHPTRHVFEVFAHGTSNPWGLDYNARGDFFVEACVIPHLWHIVQGGRYERQAGSHFNPHTYADIPTIAKHRHYVGANPHGGNNRSDSAGGGHAHSGLLCYQGGAWPAEYHGKLFMGNIHGHRINVDVVTPKGSSYVGDRNPDFLLSNDRHCIIVAIHAGPDGNVYFCDWSDKQVCHLRQPEVWDRTNGRIFKVSHTNAKPVVGLDLQKLSDAELVKLQTSGNEWMVRHSRRILQERAAGGGAGPKAALTELATKGADETARLRGLWALHACGYTDWTSLRDVVYADPSPVVRAWSIRLIADMPTEHANIGKLLNSQALMHRSNVTPPERLAMASAATRMTAADRRGLELLLYNNPVGDADPLLGLMTWYAVEPLVEKAPADAVGRAERSGYSTLLPFVARRVGEIGTPDAIKLLTAKLAAADRADRQLAYVRGLQEAVKGRRGVPMPDGWDRAFAAAQGSKDAEVRTGSLALAVAFNDPVALGMLFAAAADRKADPAARQSALASLLDTGHDRLGGVLKDLFQEPAMRTAAIRGMARVADDGVPGVLLAGYANLSPADKRDAVATLASRAKYGTALLDAIEKKTVPAADVPAETIRQLRNLNDAAIAARIAAVWGTVRDTPADRKKLIADWTKKVSAGRDQPGRTPAAELSAGRAVYARVCGQCHTLYGEGGKVGPDITGSNRADLGYLLENMFDPSAVIPKEYAATKLELADGRVVTGIVKAEDARTLTVATATETLTIPAKDVDKRVPSDQSMMPDDLTKQLTEPELRALVAYLRHPSQVPLPKEEKRN